MKVWCWFFIRALPPPLVTTHLQARNEPILRTTLPAKNCQCRAKTGMRRRAGVRGRTSTGCILPWCKLLSWWNQRKSRLLYLFVLFTRHVYEAVYLWGIKPGSGLGSVPLPHCSFVTQPQVPGRYWTPWLRWWHQARGEPKALFHLGHLDLSLAFLCLLNPKRWCRWMGCQGAAPCTSPAAILGAVALEGCTSSLPACCEINLFLSLI